jgi:hypothetical protein
VHCNSRSVSRPPQHYKDLIFSVTYTVLFQPTVRNFRRGREICPRSPGFLTKSKTFLAVCDTQRTVDQNSTVLLYYSDCSFNDLEHDRLIELLLPYLIWLNRLFDRDRRSELASIVARKARRPWRPGHSVTVLSSMVAQPQKLVLCQAE